MNVFARVILKLLAITVVPLIVFGPLVLIAGKRNKKTKVSRAILVSASMIFNFIVGGLTPIIVCSFAIMFTNIKELLILLIITVYAIIMSTFNMYIRRKLEIKKSTYTIEVIIVFLVGLITKQIIF